MLGRRRSERAERSVGNKLPTTIAAETHLKGLLRFDSALQINGKFDGEIHSAGCLTVGEGAMVCANIRVGSMVIGGTVRGDIKATDSVEMLATARVCGDIGAARLIVADGAVFEGELEMGGSPKERDVSVPPVEG